MKAWWSFLAVTGTALFNASNGHGQDPLNSSDVPQASSTRGPHNDLNIVPIAGGSTDLGIGGGAFMGLSRVKQGYDPYVWNIDAAAIAMFEYSNKQFQMPYLDVYARLVIPRTMGAPLRLSLRPSFTAESTSGYYGMGNASTDISPAGAPSSYYYDSGSSASAWPERAVVEQPTAAHELVHPRADRLQHLAHLPGRQVRQRGEAHGGGVELAVDAVEQQDMKVGGELEI